MVTTDKSYIKWVLRGLRETRKYVADGKGDGGFLVIYGILLRFTCLIAGDPTGLTGIEDRWNELVAAAESRAFGETVLEVAKGFAGSPYVGGTLDQSETESLVVYLDGFDCVTLVENSLALARTLRASDPNPRLFPAELEKIRYRNGKIQGYCSRLHYTTDWGYDNQQKGILVNITKQIGGIVREKPVHFMTRHRQSYRQLADDAFWEEMKKIEQGLNKRASFYIPKERLPEIESKIQNGDILALTSTVEGLDIAHIGLAVLKERLYMLHASTRHKSVIVTEQPLAEYLSQRKNQSGVIVYRPLDPFLSKSPK